MRVYTVVLEYDSEARAYSVRVPSLRGCYTQGDTVEGALSNAREAIAGHIAALEQVGATVPEEGDKLPVAALAAVAGARGDERVLLSRVAA
ncbi:MAG TPA: type II toxin-antitoxin system HicB family antitoxin [Chloroflexota bacterium]|nr:type II toxin-antitoxin system HicB family antitoxin [Chloroflexota bacterium]